MVPGYNYLSLKQLFRKSNISQVCKTKFIYYQIFIVWAWVKYILDIFFIYFMDDGVPPSFLYDSISWLYFCLEFSYLLT